MCWGRYSTRGSRAPLAMAAVAAAASCAVPPSSLPRDRLSSRRLRKCDPALPGPLPPLPGVPLTPPLLPLAGVRTPAGNGRAEGAPPRSAIGFEAMLTPLLGMPGIPDAPLRAAALTLACANGSSTLPRYARGAARLLSLPPRSPRRAIVLWQPGYARQCRSRAAATGTEGCVGSFSDWAVSWLSQLRLLGSYHGVRPVCVRSAV